MNVTRSIGQISASKDVKITLVSPKTGKNPEIPGIKFDIAGRSTGHFWEQITLPRFWQGQLINFCNMGPAIKKNQVLCIHDANVFLAPESYGKVFRLYYRALQPLLARRAIKVTTVSKFSADQIAKYLPLKSSDIMVLPNGHEHVNSWNSSLGLNAREAIYGAERYAIRPFILVLGSRARHKNLSMLFSFAEVLDSKNIDLVVAGGQSDIFAATELTKKRNIKHLGFVTDHDLAYLMEHALCLVFPSLTEGFGLPALEAMAIGCPVISTDRASLPEICGNAALFAAPDQPDQWIKNIERLANNPNLRADLIGRGLEQVKKFKWSKTASGYVELVSNSAK